MNLLLCVEFLSTIFLELIPLLFCYIEQKFLIYCIVSSVFFSYQRSTFDNRILQKKKGGFYYQK